MQYHHKTKYLIFLFSWLIWGVAALFYFHVYFLRISIGGIQPILVAHFHVDALHLSYVAASFIYAYLLAQIPAGIFVERYGERAMLTFAAMLCAVGCFLFGETGNLTLLFLSRFLMGISAAFSLIIVLSLAKNWFSKKQFAILNALTISLGTIGGVLAEAPLTELLKKTNLSVAMTIFAVFSILLGFFAFVFVRNAPSIGKKGGNVTMNWAHTLKGLGLMLGNSNVWKAGLFAGFLLVPLGTFALLWGSPFLIAEYHIKLETAEMITSLMFIGGGVGAPLISWFSNKMENRVLWMRLGAAFSILLMWMILYLKLPLSIIMVLTFLLGIAISSSALSYVVVRERISGPYAPTAFGLAKMIQTLCVGAILPLTGYILKTEWGTYHLHRVGIYYISSYRHALMVIPVCMLISFIIALSIRRSKAAIEEET